MVGTTVRLHCHISSAGCLFGKTNYDSEVIFPTGVKQNYFQALNILFQSQYYVLLLQNLPNLDHSWTIILIVPAEF